MHTQRQPLPTYGILVAITVSVSTLASSGNDAMYRTARAASATSITGSGRTAPSACIVPAAEPAAMLGAAVPLSSCPPAVAEGRPARPRDPVSRVIACLVAVYAIDCGRGLWAESDPLLMIRPPRGFWLRITRNASRVHRKAPVRFTATTWFHAASGN